MLPGQTSALATRWSWGVCFLEVGPSPNYGSGALFVRLSKDSVPG